jgi:glycerophosphoryl diester phosphodiesterase
VQGAAYLATRGLDVVGAVSTALTKFGYDKETKQVVLIQSEDPPVLSAFKKFPKFKRVYEIEFDITDISKPSVVEISEMANAVKLRRSSAVQVDGFYLTGFTHALVDRLHAAKIEVYVGVLKNEFMSLAFDYWADPMKEIATDTWAVPADGLITDFPATAAAYFSKWIDQHYDERETTNGAWAAWILLFFKIQKLEIPFKLKDYENEMFC